MDKESLQHLKNMLGMASMVTLNMMQFSEKEHEVKEWLEKYRRAEDYLQKMEKIIQLEEKENGQEVR